MQGGQIKEYLLKYNTSRRIVQLLSFLFFSAIIFNLGVLPLLFPVLWTWGLPQNTVGDAFTAIQFMFFRGAFPWLAFASFLITGILIGKSLCGWVCPFGFAQDLLDFVKRKKRDFSLRTHQSMIYMKYLVLTVALFVGMTFAGLKTVQNSTGYQGALGIFTEVPFTAVSPAETLFAMIPRGIRNFIIQLGQRPAVEVLGGITSVPALFWAEFVILIAVLAFVVLVPRGWCRYFCPHGAIMAVMNQFSFIGLRRDPVKCTRGGCGACVKVCPMRVPILDLPWEKFSHEECIYCMKCVDACKDRAIRPTYP